MYMNKCHSSLTFSCIALLLMWPCLLCALPCHCQKLCDSCFSKLGGHGDYECEAWFWGFLGIKSSFRQLFCSFEWIGGLTQGMATQNAQEIDTWYSFPHCVMFIDIYNLVVAFHVYQHDRNLNVSRQFKPPIFITNTFTFYTNHYIQNLSWELHFFLMLLYCIHHTVHFIC